MVTAITKALIIFARPPLPGRVKTRLAVSVGDATASKLYGAMLNDVLENAVGLGDIRTFVFWAAEDGVIPPYAPENFENFLQNGAGLGERMANAFESVFAGGIEACCIIGSDSPDLPALYILQAFDLLEQGRADLIFGPTADGGYYLAGMRSVQRELFDGISWGTATVLEESLERAKDLNLRVRLLPTWYDIDTLEDLQRFLNLPGTAAPRLRKAVSLLATHDTNKFSEKKSSP